MPDNEDIKWAVRDIKDRSSKILLYRDYYDGRHRMPWSTPKWNVAFSELFKRFRDNLCPKVVDAKAERLRIESIDGGDDTINAAITSIWTREQLEKRQGEIHKNGLKDGDAFVIIWPDELNQARWTIQRGDRMAVEYKGEPQGEIERAAKLWPEKEYITTEEKCHWRLNLYYVDRIERYVTQDEITSSDVPEKSEKWLAYEPDDPTEDEDAGVETSAVILNQYGRVPVFPYPNNADLGAYGRSELKDVIPLQDALNKSVANMLIAGEFISWPQRYLIGVEVDTDEEGNPTGKEQKQALDRILTIGNPNAKAGSFEAADITKFIAEQDSYRQEMARISGTPLHQFLFGGEFPSGAALEVAEQPLMSAIDDRVSDLKPAWEAAMGFSLTIENATFDQSAINAHFKDTRYHDPATEADRLRVMKELGIPDEEIWREMGYDEDKIKEFTDAKAERVLSMQAAFDAGTQDTINPSAEPPGAVPFGA